MDFFHNLLVTALTPITLISGVGLMLLCMTNRYNHTTDRIRQLIKLREDGGLKNEPDLDREIRLIFRRASNLRRSMLCLTLSTVCAGLLVATNVCSEFTGQSFVTLSAFWLICSLILIVSSTAFFCLEVSLSLHALSMAVTHLPRPMRPASQTSASSTKEQAK